VKEWFNRLGRGAQLRIAVGAGGIAGILLGDLLRIVAPVSGWVIIVLGAATVGGTLLSLIDV